MVEYIETCFAPHDTVMFLVFAAKFCSPQFRIKDKISNDI